MSKRLLVLLAVIALVTVAFSAPVGAGPQLRGEIYGHFNVGIVTGEGAAPDVSWVATIDFGNDHTYHLVWYPETLPVAVDGYTWVLEDWKIFESLDVEFTDGVITTFEPGPPVVEAHEFAWGTPFGVFYAHGRIDAVDADVDPHGLFHEMHEGLRTYWTGELGATPVEFFATMWIRGLR